SVLPSLFTLPCSSQSRRINSVAIWRRKLTKHTKNTCLIIGCDRTHHARGWCWMHHDRWLKYGDPESVAFVLIKSPEEAFARRTEWRGDCLFWPGSKTKHRNGRVYVNGKKQQAHRYAWERVNGPIPDGMFIVR